MTGDEEIEQAMERASNGVTTKEFISVLYSEKIISEIQKYISETYDITVDEKSIVLHLDEIIHPE